MLRLSVLDIRGCHVLTVRTAQLFLLTHPPGQRHDTFFLSFFFFFFWRACLFYPTTFLSNKVIIARRRETNEPVFLFLMEE